MPRNVELLYRAAKRHDETMDTRTPRLQSWEYVRIYVATQQGIDVAPDKYAVVCDAHATIVGVSSIPKARQFMKCPEFCEECMEIAKHRTE